MLRACVVKLSLLYVIRIQQLHDLAELCECETRGHVARAPVGSTQVSVAPTVRHFKCGFKSRHAPFLQVPNSFLLGNVSQVGSSDRNWPPLAGQEGHKGQKQTASEDKRCV